MSYQEPARTCRMDSLSSPGFIAVRLGKQFCQRVFAQLAGCKNRHRLDTGERHRQAVAYASERVRLTASGRPGQDHVGFGGTWHRVLCQVGARAM